ncbi:MAG: hypothetical protein QG652_638 [Pseudomonadota bacterium]|nr:hypothetical protein [Pseudomonadota bacterium]
MDHMTLPCLQDCIRRYHTLIPQLEYITKPLPDFISQAEAGKPDALIHLYENVYPLLEKFLWSGNADFHPLLACYQSLFREQETLIEQNSRNDRYNFILSITVADRPPHLRACLESILQVCQLYGYGGKTAGYYDKIKVIVAEDSADERNILRHIELVNEYRQRGLNVVHFNQPEQHELLQSIPPPLRERLGNILTTQPKEKFFLKGQAANRNLSYLKFLQLTKDRNKTLYYLVDSDQSFCVNRQTATGDEAVYALNYFHCINKIFRDTDTLMLTGKLVGDPPVSPAVMTSNFLDDITAFFTTLAHTRGNQCCSFHGLPEHPANDAAYHDMASLFGFKNKDATFIYRCRLEGEHNHEACLRDFSQRLNSFFFGEHLTRKTFFSYGNGFDEIVPARTIYPGNYIVNYEGLKYIIPFGHLRLRMSGPTAGRLIQAEIKERFASVNLPMLHRRTTQGDFAEEFRPGVELKLESIDLSNEFERQFFGDLMLFSVAELVSQADVNQPFQKEVMTSVIDRKEMELLALYQQKHVAVLDKNRLLNNLVFNTGHWWLSSPVLADALHHVKNFIQNIEHNFSDQSLAYQQIQSSEHRAVRKKQIIEALMNYRTERDAWDRLFQ